MHVDTAPARKKHRCRLSSVENTWLNSRRRLPEKRTVYGRESTSPLTNNETILWNSVSTRLYLSSYSRFSLVHAHMWTYWTLSFCCCFDYIKIDFIKAQSQKHCLFWAQFRIVAFIQKLNNIDDYSIDGTCPSENLKRSIKLFLTMLDPNLRKQFLREVMNRLIKHLDNEIEKLSQNLKLISLRLKFMLKLKSCFVTKSIFLVTYCFLSFLSFFFFFFFFLVKWPV